MRALIATAVLAATLSVGAAQADAPEAPAVASNQKVALNWLWSRVPRCRFEDGKNCKWDARKRGDGQGTSFIDVDGTAYYMPWKDR